MGIPGDSRPILEVGSFKLADCTKDNKTSNCKPCEEGSTFMDHYNSLHMCRRCKSCDSELDKKKRKDFDVTNQMLPRVVHKPPTSEVEPLVYTGVPVLPSELDSSHPLGPKPYPPGYADKHILLLFQRTSESAVPVPGTALQESAPSLKPYPPLGQHASVFPPACQRAVFPVCCRSSSGTGSAGLPSQNFISETLPSGTFGEGECPD
ncbi:hypothetical protein UY3_18312 [Chelonia mydas]|uniref:Uncharacterized protein n=1 Tax=Chelonia mydas TaxID=8469 RepID=M7B8N4_CHEMY|nr:hypothetical protein UY3_18312 [Chelonia mydas]